ncbi:hypothetical protein K474DRAFT_1680317 [Panus rudis PR-1116 ss-1]|nr:hypothetical protein K474DRAFT_1680317 [Panus rudis PR-1116 ss-1]
MSGDFRPIGIFSEAQGQLVRSERWTYTRSDESHQTLYNTFANAAVKRFAHIWCWLPFMVVCCIAYVTETIALQGCARRTGTVTGVTASYAHSHESHLQPLLRFLAGAPSVEQLSLHFNKVITLEDRGVFFLDPGHGRKNIVDSGRARASTSRVWSAARRDERKVWVASKFKDAREDCYSNHAYLNEDLYGIIKRHQHRPISKAVMRVRSQDRSTDGPGWSTYSSHARTTRSGEHVRDLSYLYQRGQLLTPSVDFGTSHHSNKRPYGHHLNMIYNDTFCYYSFDGDTGRFRVNGDGFGDDFQTWLFDFFINNDIRVEGRIGCDRAKSLAVH